MKTEELKMILDALASMGAAGKDAFIWWLVADKVLPVAVLFFVACLGCWILMTLIRRAWDQDRDSHIVKQIATLLGKDFCDDYGRIQRVAIYEEVRRLKSKEPA